MITEEGFKGGVHATMGALLTVMAAYNLMRLCGSERTRRNIVNAVLYVPGAVYEFANAKHHWGKAV